MLELIEANHLAYFKYIPSKLGTRISTIASVTVINSGLQTSMFNIAYGGLAEAQLQQTDVIIQQFANQPFAWWIPPSQHSPELEALLTDKGFEQEAAEHAMLLKPENYLPQRNHSTIVIHKVDSAERLQDFCKVLLPYDPHITSIYTASTLPHLMPSQHLYVGYQQLNPVVIGVRFNQADTCSIFSMLTRESARGCGFGTSLLHHLIQESWREQAKTITLSASNGAAERLYARLGFQNLGAFACFESPIHK